MLKADPQLVDLATQWSLDHEGINLINMLSINKFILHGQLGNGVWLEEIGSWRPVF